jgi:hypothetical protein
VERCSLFFLLAQQSAQPGFSASPVLLKPPDNLRHARTHVGNPSRLGEVQTNNAVRGRKGIKRSVLSQKHVPPPRQKWTGLIETLLPQFLALATRETPPPEHLLFLFTLLWKLLGVGNPALQQWAGVAENGLGTTGLRW